MLVSNFMRWVLNSLEEYFEAVLFFCSRCLRDLGSASLPRVRRLLAVIAGLSASGGILAGDGPFKFKSQLKNFN